MRSDWVRVVVTCPCPGSIRMRETLKFAVVAERHLGDEDMYEIIAIAADFGLEILGPPPN